MILLEATVVVDFVDFAVVDIFVVASVGVVVVALLVVTGKITGHKMLI